MVLENKKTDIDAIYLFDSLPHDPAKMVVMPFDDLTKLMHANDYGACRQT